jgi:archaellum component FlaC
MGRSFKRNKLPKTSISISEELYELLIKKKNRRHTMDEHLRRIVSTHNSIVSSYNVIKEEFDFLEDSYNKASKKNQEYCETIENLKREIEVLKRQGQVEIDDGNKVGPASGVAAITSKVNQSTKEIVEQEVIQ